MGRNVLGIFCRAAVDIAGQVEVIVVLLGNLGQADQTGVAGQFKPFGKDIDNLVNVLMA